MPRRRAANGGFTLVELLVVIGIIALLIAILLPALSKARQSAKLVHCAANLRSMWQAAELCAAERRGWVAPTGLSGRVYFKSTDRGYPGMGDINCQRYHWYSKPDGLLRPVPVTVVLAHYMNLAPSIGTREEIQEVVAKPAYAAMFQCPAGP